MSMEIFKRTIKSLAAWQLINLQTTNKSTENLYMQASNGLRIIDIKSAQKAYTTSDPHHAPQHLQTTYKYMEIFKWTTSH